MKTNPNHEPDDRQLHGLLRTWEVKEELPPRFAEAVWRKIEAGERGAESLTASWLEVVGGWLFRPRLALAAALAAMIAGALLGFLEAGDAARDIARVRYAQAVNPFVNPALP